MPDDKKSTEIAKIKMIVSEVAKIIKPMVKSEVIKTMKSFKSFIREEVKKEINQVLAEQFVATMVNKNASHSLVEQLSAGSEQRYSKSEDINSKEQKAKRRKALLEKIGANENTTLGLIYEDVDHEAVPSMVENVHGAYVDTEDEGVDLSTFGI